MAPFVAIAALLLTSAPEETPEAPAPTSIAVPAVRPGAGVPAGAPDVVTELLLEALLNRHGIKALGPSDVSALLNAEEQKALLGCDQDSCMAELAGAMGADRLIAGTLGKLGALHVISLKLIDARAATVVSRASTRVAKIEEVADAVGPLTDQLLGRAGRPPSAPPMVAPPLRPAVTVLEPKDFCDRAEAHARGLRESAFRPAAVEERRALLEDLLHTPFKLQFDRKRSCIWSWDGRVGSALRRAWIVAPRPAVALDARRRLEEWHALTRQLKLLEEAYETGLEKEKHGVGHRPGSLPFAVEEVALWQPAATAEVKRFRAAYGPAHRVVKQAIAAARKGDQKRFEGLFSAPDPKRSRTSPHYVYDQLRSYLKSGSHLDPCPLFVLRRDELKHRVERFEREGVLVGCMRRHKEDFATTDNVYLIKEPRGWRILRW